MNQVPVKWCWDYELKDEGCFPTKSTYAGHNTPVPVVPLSDLRDLFKDYYIGLAALVQTPEDVLLRAAVNTRLQQATQRLLASLGEVGK